jgi:UDP-glucose:(heptosyl)LPS alpha-1,3-glucosyltransferase
VALSKKGHEVCVAAESWPVTTHAYHVRIIGSSGPASYAHQCRRAFGNLKDTVIFSLERTIRQHIYRAGDGVHACWLDRRKYYRSRIKNFLTIFNRKHHVLVDLEKILFNTRTTDWVIANSKMVKQEILEHFPFPEDRIRVISPGVDLGTFQPCGSEERRKSLRTKFEIPHDVVLWSFVGSGFERKGLKWAIEIAAKQREKVWLIVLGKGERSRYQQIAKNLGFSARLKFAPEATAALEVYQASDAFILPTIYDPCSNACLEASACGLPVLTSSGNGAKDWTTGVVMEDPSNISKSVEQCSAFTSPRPIGSIDPKLRARLDEKPSWDATFQLIEEVAQHQKNSLLC